MITLTTRRCNIFPNMESSTSTGDHVVHCLSDAVTIRANIFVTRKYVTGRQHHTAMLRGHNNIPDQTYNAWDGNGDGWTVERVLAVLNDFYVTVE